MAFSDVQKVVLSLTASALFKIPSNIPENTDWTAVKKEAVAQAVFPLIYKKAAPMLPLTEKSAWDELYFRYIEKNMRVIAEHSEVSGLMKQNGIPYVTFKGCASASYYPYPALRSMGDVDFLVASENLITAEKILIASGFSVAGERDDKHLTFKREPNSVWEMHRTLNGTPKGEVGIVCEAFLKDMISTSVPYKTDFGSFNIPDAFHHGLVLLLHTASHMTKEGVGLRHLCDWAVFVSGFSDEDFCDTFEDKLKACGLWHFAQILTYVSERYLGLSSRSWTGEVDDELLSMLMEDILRGGNFGQKDKDRYRQIKYISNLDEKTVDDKNIILQAWMTLKRKARVQNKSTPAVFGEYLRLVFSGKKRIDSGKTLSQARQRKRIYQDFHLFEVEQ